MVLPATEEERTWPSTSETVGRTIPDCEGFLNANTDPYSRSPANYGLMDQIAALHWIQENIAVFGGDPTNVTLLGHGTGAACVNFLVTSSAVPEGVLFHRAMLMSGSGLSPWALIQEPSRYAAQVAIHANCSPELPHPHLLKCLREKPLELLLSTPVIAPDFAFAFGPSVDGVVIDTGEPPGRSSDAFRLFQSHSWFKTLTSCRLVSLQVANNDNAESFSITAEIKQEAQETTLRLLPAKSKRVYEKEMVKFDNWRKKRGLGEGAITEEVLLAYFFNVEKHFAASSMWTKYSMLKSMLKVHKGIDISKYVGSRKYKTKKAKILERNQIEDFLKKAPDVEYLQVKVALILGVAGASRCNELTFLDIRDVQDKGSYLYVLIPDTKTNISRSFTVMEEAFSVNAVEMCRKYISLRPKAADGKYTTQHAGINTISKTFSKVASFLGLPDPESFTGHGMRRSSVTLLANAGGDITTVKRHGGWKSTTVAKNYIEESLSSKMAIDEKIQVLPNVGGDNPHYNEFDSGSNKPIKVEPQNAITILNNVLLRKSVVSKLSRYDLLLGVVKAEAYFAFNGEDVQYGIEADRRSKILRTFVRNTYSYHLSEILATIVNEYTDWERPVQHPINIRDETLEALSDAQYVAPVVHTADLHSAEHRNSYLYVFDYQTKFGDYPQLAKTKFNCITEITLRILGTVQAKKASLKRGGNTVHIEIHKHTTSTSNIEEDNIVMLTLYREDLAPRIANTVYVN
ncbi:hypothetical protein NQ315_014173 [Exocentrus adspersus]|uniref:Tyr recombinase domain-containing protein n=1 Tax=Exocentrus adspersus TaxID=1586481 RepID=A0AAV8VVM6_9CUCU|nr:hypothetical protein NQ315_014173 [Exocentrus adspersus]